MRRFYSLIIYLVTPLVLIYLLFRGLRDSDYLKRWPERFGFTGISPAKNGILIHAASVGEVSAASPLIRAIQERYPEYPLTITTVTPTGSRRVSELFGTTMSHCYVPFDLPGAVRRFYKNIAPQLVIVMETEIWPNLFTVANKNGILIMIANARLSENSLNNYQKFAPWMGRIVTLASGIGAQSSADEIRLKKLGATERQVSLTGNLKFEMTVPADAVNAGASLRHRWGSQRPVFVAGSIRAAETAVVLQAWRKVIEQFPDALLVMAPRHPEQFESSVKEAERAGFKTGRRSVGVALEPGIQCLIVDSLGELMMFYAASDIAFVGGTLCDVGGHNALEPAALGKPVLLGPHTFNLGEIADRLIAAVAARRVTDSASLAQAITELMVDLQQRESMGKAGQALVESGRGAVDATMQLLAQVLGPVGHRD